MRDEDIARLARPVDLADSTRADDHFQETLGLSQPELRALQRQVFDDLDQDHLGVGWWRPALGPRKRILIGDYLAQVPSAVMMNLTEARLHQMEAIDAWERHEKRLARSVGPDLSMKMPPYTSAADLLPEKLATMHVAGFFRALGSALDCLAATIIGVLPIPISIVKADFAGVLSWLRREKNKAAVREVWHTALLSDLEGWILWFSGTFSGSASLGIGARCA